MHEGARDRKTVLTDELDFMYCRVYYGLRK